MAKTHKLQAMMHEKLKAKSDEVDTHEWSMASKMLEDKVRHLKALNDF
jgi:hypothetical protein